MTALVNSAQHRDYTLKSQRNNWILLFVTTMRLDNTLHTEDATS